MTITDNWRADTTLLDGITGDKAEAIACLLENQVINAYGSYEDFKSDSQTANDVLVPLVRFVFEDIDFVPQESEQVVREDQTNGPKMFLRNLGRFRVDTSNYPDGAASALKEAFLNIKRNGILHVFVPFIIKNTEMTEEGKFFDLLTLSIAE